MSQLKLSFVGSREVIELPPARKRGRPPMLKEVPEVGKKPKNNDSQDEVVEKRRPGRPPKVREQEDEALPKRQVGRPPKLREQEEHIVKDTPKRKPGRPPKKSMRMRMRLSWWSCRMMLSCLRRRVCTVGAAFSLTLVRAKQILRGSVSLQRQILRA